MTTRRRRGEDGISFEHRGPCRDPHRHRHCPGLWRGELTLGYSSDAVSMGHLALKRAIRHAEANDLVSRNVAVLADTPKGQEGRPSKSLTLDQAVAVITAARTLPVMELRPGLKDVRRPAELMHA